MPFWKLFRLIAGISLSELYELINFPHKCQFTNQLFARFFFVLQTETAHEFGMESLKIGLGSEIAQNFFAKRFASESFGEIERFGLKFKNPLGIAAGFDKNGKVVNQFAALGFGFVEVGTVTFDPQEGNPKPRLFRLAGR